MLVYMIACSVLLTTSCATVNKKMKGSSAQNSESKIPGTNAKRTLVPATPIREVKEKLVPTREKAPDNHKYYVIVGSFKSYSNALRQQREINAKGFRAEILKNEAGLYRISVKATDNIEEAHSEIRRIWVQFPEYSDTWMLVLIK